MNTKLHLHVENSHSLINLLESKEVTTKRECVNSGIDLVLANIFWREKSVVEGEEIFPLVKA